MGERQPEGGGEAAPAGPGAGMDAPASAGRGRSPSRPTVEFLIALLIGILFARAFAAEAYIVPTGSMAPTLLGLHREYTCDECRFRFDLGMDETGRSGRPVCPNCGAEVRDLAAAVEANGDRLLVQKHLFDLRPPRRWEVAVFQNPSDPSQAYVKRIVGLPGESVLIRGGDIYADGRIARKSLAEQRSMRILVYDHAFRPADAGRYPRWVSRREGDAGRDRGWAPSGTGYVHEGFEAGQARDAIDWLEYRHIRPERRDTGPIRDFTPYNGADLPGENRVDDLMIEADVEAPDGHLLLRLGGAGDAFEVSVPFGDAGFGPGPRVTRNGVPVPLSAVHTPHVRSGHLEASWIDRRLLVALDGEPLFEPIDCDDPAPTPRHLAVAPAIGTEGGPRVRVRNLRIYRDIYYTDALSYAPRRPFGVDEPFPLGPGEYFVLGDNSPVSNDSRFWPNSPVVKAERLLGKPFLVHLPGQGLPLKVFGHELYWIPDPREIRYIR